MSQKLLKRKNWLTLEDSARCLSITLSEEVSPGDLIQLALEGHFNLSVMLPRETLAVKYELNESAHDPAPTLDNTPDGLLARLDLFSRSSWALIPSTRTLYEPNFDMTTHIAGLWGFPCFESSGNMDILGQRLSQTLSSRPINDSPSDRLHPIVVQHSDSQDIYALVTLSDEFRVDFSAELAPRSKYTLCSLPENSFLGIKQDELQHFITSLNEPESTDDKALNPPDDRANDKDIIRTQRALAALAIGLSKKQPAYRTGDKPNALRLAKLATDHLRDSESDRTPFGFSETLMRETISAALKACPELKD
ncbi:hypothetical protein ACNQ6O_02370 [Marinobacter sp. SBS5]|uniref:hypothetical protein n=1 Tax=Marinobacter sp. SBS5 TaxID=3401754 RepID=UPI003AAD2252